MGLAQKNFEVLQRAVVGVNGGVIGDVIAGVAQWGRIKGQQPERGHAKILEVVQPFGYSRKVADPVSIAVTKSADMELVDDRVFIPLLALLQHRQRFDWGCSLAHGARLLSIRSKRSLALDGCDGARGRREPERSGDSAPRSFWCRATNSGRPSGGRASERAGLDQAQGLPWAIPPIPIG